jgi:putative MATE family efflux protein
MLIGLVPAALSMCYAFSLRETGETFVPMVASGSAVLINLLFNWLLIFGKLGFPALGVLGAAIATVISRFAELAIIVTYAHTHTKRFPFFKGVCRSLYVPGALAKQIVLKGTPLLLNEAFWSLGMTTMMQCYSMRGISAVAALNISSTVSNLFNIVFMSIGSSIGIIVGNLLGANKLEEAKDTDRKIIALSVCTCLFFGVALAVAAPFIPRLYNTGDEVKTLATRFLWVSACMMPFNAFTHACYFTLRSGGQTRITMLFDSCFVWAICIPVAFVLSRFTALPILPLYIVCCSLELIKCVIGFLLVKSNRWVVNIVRSEDGGEHQPFTIFATAATRSPKVRSFLNSAGSTLLPVSCWSRTTRSTASMESRSRSVNRLVSGLRASGSTSKSAARMSLIFFAISASVIASAPLCARPGS